MPVDGSMTAGKYFLGSDVTVNGRIYLTGDTELILGDGYTLDVKGIYIPAGSTLTIYGQSAGTGTIDSHPSGGSAIGGYSGHDNGSIIIHGGTITAKGYDNCAGIGSNDSRTGGAITIYGGTVTAKGGKDGAAIGGGKNCSGGTIILYGGDITANGPTDSDCPENGAGIGGGGDMYMAACAYVYYRLYVITGDRHYRDYAEFIHNNTRQANDLYGEFGFAQPGLSHEGGHFAEQVFASHFHWLPWVTYVEVDPVSRLYDTFGAYDIAGADRLSPEERSRRNRIYDRFAKNE